MSAVDELKRLAKRLGQYLRVSIRTDLITPLDTFEVVTSRVAQFGPLVVITATIRGTFPAGSQRYCAVLSSIGGMRPIETTAGAASLYGTGIVTDGSAAIQGQESGAIAVSTGSRSATGARVSFVYLL